MRHIRQDVLAPEFFLGWFLLTATTVFLDMFALSRFLGPLAQFLFWVATHLIGMLVGVVIRSLIRVVPAPIGPIARECIMPFPIALCVSPITYTCVMSIPGVADRDVPAQIYWALYVLLVSMAISAFRLVRDHRDAGPTAASDPDTSDTTAKHLREPADLAARITDLEPPETVYAKTPPDVPILDRIPSDLRADLIRLSARDHFVEIVTTLGKREVRMRLKDAVREIGDTKGHLVHRSHWVAENAIDGSNTQGGKVTLRLINGDEIPVSRAHHKILQDEGVL
jgi:hypothetical protein